MILTPTDHLSPPSTMSRHSDSDATSECDIDGLTPGRDGTSISSLGSSSSPPPEVTHTMKLLRQRIIMNNISRIMIYICNSCFIAKLYEQYQELYTNVTANTYALDIYIQYSPRKYSRKESLLYIQINKLQGYSRKF